MRTYGVSGEAPYSPHSPLYSSAVHTSPWGTLPRWLYRSSALLCEVCPRQYRSLFFPLRHWKHIGNYPHSRAIAIKWCWYDEYPYWIWFSGYGRLKQYIFSISNVWWAAMIFKIRLINKGKLNITKFTELLVHPIYLHYQEIKDNHRPIR